MEIQPVKLLFVGGFCLLVAGYVFQGGNRKSAIASFVAVAAPDQAEPAQVLVIGPTCNSVAGVRTRQLADRLAQAQIPYKHTDSFSFSVSNPEDFQGISRLNQVMQGDAPVVFVNGRAKANPQFEEVVAEYSSMPRR
jgi:hypothetical protein